MNQLANGLTELGLGKGDRLALMLPNCLEFMDAWFAASRIGAVEVPVNTAYVGGFLAHVLNNSESTMMVAHVSFLAALESVMSRLEHLQTVLLVGDREGAQELSRVRAIPFEDAFSEDSGTPAVEVMPADLMAIMYTSGTTGASKGVTISHQYFCLMAQDNCRYRRLAEEDVVYTCLPLFHGNAQGLSTLPALYMGGTLALGERFSASNFWDELESCGATHFNSIGAMINILWRQPPSPKEKRHRARLCFAVPVPREALLGSEERWGVKLLEGYGLTESNIVAYQPWDAPRPGSFGKPIPEYEVAIVDDQDEAVGVGVIGEVVTRPRRPYSMMSGYFNMPDRTAEAYRNLWFHTGDYAQRDEDGYYFFVDRKKDAIRRRGENISSAELEAAVQRHPAIAECAVVAIPAELGEDDVKLCAVTRAGLSVTPEALHAWCRAELPRFMVPRYIELMDALPKTPTARVEKYRLRQQALNAATWDSERT